VKAVDRSPTSFALAAEARSILSCPGAVSLVVDGVEQVHGNPRLVLEDRDGVPVFVCPAGSPVDQAADDRRTALLEISSGLTEHQGLMIPPSVVMAARLRSGGHACADADASGDWRAAVVETRKVVLVRPRRDGEPERHLPVPLDEFRSPAHDLNAGYLQKSVEHANHCHQRELRYSVAQATQTRVDDIAGVALADLRPDGVTLRWVDAGGAQGREIRFSESARTPVELGQHLRRELHAGIC
jgi:hypothetical protein